MDSLIGGVPLVGLIMALVEWIKKIGVPSGALPFVSMLIGLIIGIGYQYSLQPMVTFADWFAALIYGIALGLTASGLYAVGSGLVEKAK